MLGMCGKSSPQNKADSQEVPDPRVDSLCTFDQEILCRVRGSESRMGFLQGCRSWSAPSYFRGVSILHPLTHVGLDIGKPGLWAAQVQALLVVLAGFGKGHVLLCLATQSYQEEVEPNRGVGNG